MRTTIMILTMLLVSGLHAQTDSLPPMPDPQCLMATEEETWLALDLTSEQLQGAKALQTACATDCSTVKGAGEDAVALQGVMDKYLTEMREVLGEEKFQRWVEWCDRRPAKG